MRKESNSTQEQNTVNNNQSPATEPTVISLCCSRENESAFMDAWKELLEVKGDVTLCSGYIPYAHALICDTEGMEKLNDVLNKGSDFPLLFLLDDPISSFWRERAEYVFQPPYGYEVILRHVLKLAGRTIHTPSKNLIQCQAQACLESLCIPSRLLGHRYLVEGVLKLFSEPYPGRPGLLQEIYAHIAQQYDSSPVMVNRAIRHGVEVCWKKSAPDKLKPIFGYHNHDLLGIPTNGEFLHALYEHLRLRLYPSRGETDFQEQLHLISQRHGIAE